MRWTEERIELLREMYRKVPAKELAGILTEQFGEKVTVSSIHTIMKRKYGNSKKRVWTEEYLDFIRKTAPGKSVEDITALFNARFGTEFKRSKIRACMNNYGIVSGYKNDGHKIRMFTQEQAQWLKDNRIGFSFEETTEKFNKRFGTSFTETQIKTWCHAHKLGNGLDAKWKPGHASFNKGMKGWFPPGSEKTRFQKGHKVANALPVGTEVTDQEGYIKVKVAEPNVWKFKHRLVWEKEYGEIPADSVVIFLNKDRSDCRLENLKLVKRSLLSTMNRYYTGSADADITECCITLAKIKQRIRTLEKK